MNISAIHKISFNSNTPVYHVYNKNKDNSVRELNSNELRGPVLALVKRLNANDTDERNFFRKFIPDFTKTPIATSTSIGSNDVVKSTVIYGTDALNVNELRDDYYVRECYSKEDINAAIRRHFVNPSIKRTIDKSTNQPMGLVLYTKSKGSGYKLENVDIVTYDGKRIATLYDDSCNDSDMNSDRQEYEEYIQEEMDKKKALEIYPERPEDLEEEFEDTDKYFDSFITSPVPEKKKLVQGDLFAGIMFNMI